jgi:hypothetical protein
MKQKFIKYLGKVIPDQEKPEQNEQEILDLINYAKTKSKKANQDIQIVADEAEKARGESKRALVEAERAQADVNELWKHRKEPEPKLLD